MQERLSLPVQEIESHLNNYYKHQHYNAFIFRTETKQLKIALLKLKWIMPTPLIMQ